MGKQKGEAARSKARPSSSSLAASLLPSGTFTVGFGGFVGGSRLDSALPTEDVVPFTDIDSEVALHLKRLSRKDSTTKLKALTTLSVLFKQKSGKDLVAIIPQWAFEYKRLLLDYNREVRRATNETMTNLVTTVGRELAPYLKILMGPWWFSQFDPVSEISQAARRSLQAAFTTQEKRIDAIILCTAEIFMYLEENLKLTPQSMSDKTVAIDELEEMHQQVISSSLLALATLSDILIFGQLERPGSENVIDGHNKHALKAKDTAISFAQKIFSTHKCFLDFLKSKSASIRSASYSVLKSFIKNVPSCFNEENIKTIAPALLGSFNEKDPSCHSSMWDAMLLFSARFPESWTSLNIQKIVLNRFGQFIRNGCYGSQQVSYPALVLFLESVPPKLIMGEKFFLDFFQNLWAGRNPPQSSTADRLAFVKAFKECLFWGLHNASRYYDGVDAIHHFRVTLIDNVLVKLLWNEFISGVRSENHENQEKVRSNDSSMETLQHYQNKTLDTPSITCSLSNIQELGRIIVEILTGVHSLGHDLLSIFCATFQENCLDMFQQAKKLEKTSHRIEQITSFLLLLEHYVVKQGETWPLVQLVGPMLAKSFQLIRLLDSAEGVVFLSMAVSVFGPRKIIQELSVSNERNRSSGCDEVNSEYDGSHFLKVFKDTFVPWCLSGINCSISERLDLLLALLDDDSFNEQWCAIITYAANPDCFLTGSLSLDSSNVAMLALLLEKARREIQKRKEGGLDHRKGSCIDHWHHELLDLAAVSVACSPPPFRNSDTQFIWAALGGSTEDIQSSFLSRNAMLLIFQEVFKSLLTFIVESPFTWVRDAAGLLTSGTKYSVLPFKSSAEVLEMARFALQILEGSFFWLTTFVMESEQVSCISAVLFIIGWECSMVKAIDNVDGFDDEQKTDIQPRLDFVESVQTFRFKISKQFWGKLSKESQKRAGIMLIQSIKSAIFKERELDASTIASLCGLWVLEVLECLAPDEDEERILLDQFLSKDDLWPLWIIPDLSNGEGSANLSLEHVTMDVQTSVNHVFVAVVDSLISKIGFGRVIAGDGSPSAPPSIDKTTSELFVFPAGSRSWLAAEILCTWKWQGGSALGSFLPLLVAYAHREDYFPSKNLLDSIFGILLEGALFHGTSDKLDIINIYAALNGEMESIQEPYLRALASLVFTMFNHKIWQGDKALILFDLLLNKLFIRESVNRNCLKILPVLMGVLIRPLLGKSSVSTESSNVAHLENYQTKRIQDTIKDWLQKALLLPPLAVQQSGQELEEWLLLVISCYPLSARRGVEAFNIEREIDPEESSLLLDLFRKQSHSVGPAAGGKQLPAVQILLSNLRVVSLGYCWKEFGEEDWDFVLSQIKSSIQSSVVMMEEITEDVNDMIMNNSSSDHLEVTLNRLEQTVTQSDPSLVNIATNSLSAFLMFCDLIGPQLVEEAADTPYALRSEKWGPMKDRIIEGILRLFFCTGVIEAIASFCGHEASSVIASRRHDYHNFWELVALSVVKSSGHARERAVKSFEFWGLSKGAISSMYAILFSSNPIPSLQFSAYVILSTEPVLSVAIAKEGTICSLVSDNVDDQDSCILDVPPEENVHLREEVSCMIKKLPYEVLGMELMAQDRVNVFIAWSLLLSYLSSLPSESSARERMVQYMQNSANSAILDCLFQHIPLELGTVQNLRKKAEIPVEFSKAATAATHAIKTGSLIYSVESLWPVDSEKMASLACAVFGLMLQVLPAYVRGWFSELRDRSTSYAVEYFTKTWCSPPLIADELSQIKKSSLADENFSVSVSKSSNEVVATYTKDETGMDLVIRLSATYPLRPVDVECTRSLGINEVKQRRWLLSMVALVRSQNGALAEAIRRWKNNFDKEFEGVEECPICYSVIHPGNHSIPGLACRTCKHKFHAACLYKWFETSHKSTCPLCQSPF